MRTLIVTTGNSPQAPLAVRLLRSLRHHRSGRFRGDYLFVSDGLSPEARQSLVTEGARVLLYTSGELGKWVKKIGSPEHPFGKIGKPLMVLEALNRMDREYDRLVFLDPDMLVQAPVEPLFDSIIPGKVAIAPEFSQSPWTKAQFDRAVNAGIIGPEMFGKPALELNTGFWGGAVEDVRVMLREWISFMEQPELAPMRGTGPEGQAAWHDQDYFRVYYRICGAFRFHIFERGEVVHLCNKGYQRFTMSLGRSKLRAQSGNTPVIVHFAGGSWVHFLPIVLRYLDIPGVYETLWRHNGNSTLLSRLIVRLMIKKQMKSLIPLHGRASGEGLLRNLEQDSLKALGSMGFFCRDWGLAEDCYRILSSLQPDEPSWRHLLVKLYTTAGRRTQAQEELAATEERFPYDVELKPYTYGLMHKNLGELEKAVLLFERAKPDNPNYLNAQYMLGGCHASEGRYPESLACFRTVLDADPSRLDAHMASVDVHKYRGELNRAQQLLERVAIEFPGARRVSSKRRQLKRLTMQSRIKEHIGTRFGDHA